MRDFKKILLIVLLALAAMPAVAATPPLFDAMYWISGEVKVISSAGHSVDTDLSARRILFYKLLPGGFVETRAFAISDPKNGPGRYMLNIYDNDNLKINPTDTYYVAVAKDPGDSYGATPEAVTITGKGFEVKNLDIVYGAGPPLPEDGAVQLYISRQGTSDIKISWDPSEVNPNIYVLTGEGTGRFTNVVDEWKDRTDATISGDFEPHTDQAYVLHKNMVGDASTKYKEVYYKALRSSMSKADNPTVLQSAWAVGKADAVLDKFYNLISIPLSPSPDNSISSVMGDLLPDGDKAYIYDVSDPADRGFVISTKLSPGNWQETFKINPGIGYLVYREDKALEPATRTVTFVGNVLNSYSANILYQNNLIGNPYPSKITGLENAGLTGGSPMDKIYDYSLSGTTKGFSLLATFDGSNWNNSIDFSPTKGYLYYKNAVSGSFIWNPPKP